MFTVADIRNIAIQIERNGETTYRRAAELTDDLMISQALHWMADEEARHAMWFERIKSDKPLTEEQKEMENIGRMLLQEMVKGNSFLMDVEELRRAQTVKEVLIRSKAFEEDTVLFYEFLLGFMDDEETIEQLQKIIAEEKNHARKLVELEPECAQQTCEL